MSTNKEEKRPKVRGKFQARHGLDKMIFEKARENTFKTWSKTCPIKPSPLAKAGFFYVGIFDRVKCFSCGGQIEGWKDGDTAMGLHIKMFPHCDMVKNQDSKNITIERWNEMKKRQKSDTSQTEADGQAVSGINNTHHLMNSNDNVDAFCGTSFIKLLSSAMYPLLGGELDRLDTFQDKWSDEFELPSSETRWLANAGFYYAGPRDRARCFYCNGGIENWEGHDEPWSEHARNFPKCEWLIEMIGKDFVDEVQNAKASEEAEKRESKQSPAVSTQSSPSDPQKTPASEAGESEKDNKVSAKKLVEIMGSPTVKMILKSKFDAALVCRIIEEQLHETDLNFSSSDNFIKILEAAEQKITANDKSLQSSASTIDTQNAIASEEAEKRESKQSPAVSTQSSPADHQKTRASGAGDSENDTKVSAKKLVEIMGNPTVKMILKSKVDAALVCRIIEELLHETDLNFSNSDYFIKIVEAAEQKITANDKSLQSSASTIDTQTQRLANLEINGDSRQEESPKSGQKSFATAKS